LRDRKRRVDEWEESASRMSSALQRAAAHYFFNLLGSALFLTQSTAFFGGLFVAFLALAALVLGALSGELREQSFWVSSLLYYD
jgi:preprotein translocase subunit SecG